VASYLPPERWYPFARQDVRARTLALGAETLRIVEAGPATGFPVLLLHGWGASAYSFRHLLPLLARSGLYGIALDLRGHGLSAKPDARDDYRAEAMAGQVIAVLDALGLTRAALVGQSMGGAIALDAALMAGDRAHAVVLVAPVGLTPIRRIAVARALLASRWLPTRVPRWIVRAILHRVYGNVRAYEAADVDEYWAPYQDERQARAILTMIDEFDWTRRPRQRFEQMSGRIRVVLGQRDRLVTPARARSWLRALPPAQVTVVRGAGHLVAEERPEAVLGAIIGEIGKAAASA
jgi:pimeloyl-ACP methyl ester carboxylesterase